MKIASGMSPDVPAQPRGGHGGTIALLLVAMILVAGFFAFSTRVAGPGTVSSIASWLDSILHQSLGNSSEGPTSSTSISLYSPIISNGSASISFPKDYQTLAAYALGLINQDRTSNGLSPVTISNNTVAQQHADSMLLFGYFSHWDTQGFKPYMRYTLLKGNAAVEENIAYVSYNLPHFSSTSSEEAAIKSMEDSMMNNDSVCCQNGHRDNILNPPHTRVSLGFAYSSETLYFDEDFESYYVDLTFNAASDSTISMFGNIVHPTSNPSEILVTYDKTPSPESPSQLNNGPHEYGPGNLTGGVLPPCTIGCSRFEQGITVYATTWTVTPQQLRIVFSLSQFVAKYGSGAFTVYLLTGTTTDTAITSITVFVK